MPAYDEETQNAVDIARRFGMRFDPNDAASRAFAEAWGLPEDLWDEFSQRRTVTPRASDAETTTDIPSVLAELGVVAAERYQSGFDYYWTFHFTDGGQFKYSLPTFRLAREQWHHEDLLRDMAEAIKNHRHLPFDDVMPD